VFVTPKDFKQSLIFVDNVGVYTKSPDLNIAVDK